MNFLSSLDVVHFHRKAFEGTFSIEGLFSSIRKEMNRSGVYPRVEVLPWFSKGVTQRLKSIQWARKRSGNVNHITGDVHFLALGLRSKQTVLTIHDLEMLHRLTGVRRSLIKMFWFSLPVRRVAKVTVISNSTKASLIKIVGCDDEKIHVVPDAVDEMFRPSPRSFVENCPTVLHIGTNHNKNLERLCQALTGLNVKLHIVGRLSPEQMVWIQSNRIHLINSYDLSTDQIIEAYDSADIVSLVSLHEGFGMPILEAQWIERPVVTSNVSSMPEVAGDGACLVDPLNVASIRNGFKRVIDDAAFRNRLIDAGRVNRSRFSLSAVARMYISLYEQVARSIR